MKQLIYLFFAFALAGSATAAEASLSVRSSKGLRVSVVANSKQQSLGPVFAESLKNVLRAAGHDMDVTAKPAGADSAAFQLESGATDAVIVFGRLPRPLIASGFYRMEANLPSNSQATLYLVYKDRESSLKELLDASFPEAVNQEALLTAIHAAYSK